MYLILFVLHDSKKVPELLDAGEQVGVSGVTILHSSGLGRVRNKNRSGLRDDLPLIPSLGALPVAGRRVVADKGATGGAVPVRRRARFCGRPGRVSAGPRPFGVGHQSGRLRRFLPEVRFF